MLIGDLNGTLVNSDCINYSKAAAVTRYSFDFRRMVLRTGLIDLGYRGTKFTWVKKSKDGPCLKRARLDRALANVDWRLNWPNAVVYHLQAVALDHNPIMLDSVGGRTFTRPTFKYEMMWERDPRLFWVVKNAWDIQRHTDLMVNMHRKLKHTRKKLAEWNRTHFRHLAVQIEEARGKLDLLEKVPSVDSREYSIAKEALNEALTREEIFW